MESKGALEGIRVVDFTWILAGPSATRYLADLGAEVIKVERRGVGENSRNVTPFRNNVRGPNLSGYLNNGSRNKLSTTINIQDPRGKELVKRLVQKSDLVVENFSAGTMERLGLGYEVLKEVKPDIIMISLSGMGQTGPYAGYNAVGPTLQALSGITYHHGFPDRPAIGYSYSYSDYTGGWAGALSALFALNYRQQTGRGQYIDVSEGEALAVLLGPGFLDYAVNGRCHEPVGNHSLYEAAAPHNTYRCQGEDSWCVIAVFTDEEWNAFRRVLGSPSWANEKKFSTALSRVKHADELDRMVEEWTKKHTPQEVTKLLQEAGVPAGAVQNSPDLIDRDPQLKKRGTFVEMEHPEIGKCLMEYVSFRLSETPATLRRTAPLLGEHNDYVFKEIVGLSEEEYVQCIIDEVI